MQRASSPPVPALFPSASEPVGCAARSVVFPETRFMKKYLSDLMIFMMSSTVRVFGPRRIWKLRRQNPVFIGGSDVGISSRRRSTDFLLPQEVQTYPAGTNMTSNWTLSTPGILLTTAGMRPLSS